MPGTFRSTDAATFVIAYPRRTSTTGGSAALAYASSFGTASSGFTCVISRPTGADLSFTLNSLPTGITWAYVGQNPVAAFRLNMAASVYTTAGIYHASIIVTADLSYLGEADNLQWGGWVDTLNTGATNAATAATQATTAATQATTAATQATTAATQATTAATQSTAAASSAATAATQATLARKYSGNRYAANSSSVPTILTVYDDDSTTPLGTRTIANADGTAVNPKQVLSLGKVT